MNSFEHHKDIYILQWHGFLKTVAGADKVADHEWHFGLWINLRNHHILVDADKATVERAKPDDQPMYLPLNWTA